MTMTVETLRKLLKKYPDDLKVHIVIDDPHEGNIEGELVEISVDCSKTVCLLRSMGAL